MTTQSQAQTKPLTLEECAELLRKQRETENRDRKAAGWPVIMSWE